MSENDCRTANWYERGRIDGANGMPRSVYVQHQEACAEYGIRSNVTQYMAGRSKGLEFFCADLQAFERGDRDRALDREECPQERWAAISKYYSQGLKLHALRDEINELGEKMEDLIELRNELPDEDYSNRRKMQGAIDGMRLALSSLQEDYSKRVRHFQHTLGYEHGIWLDGYTPIVD